jgi:DNA-binding transcriptional ArsR family regulator
MKRKKPLIVKSAAGKVLKKMKRPDAVVVVPTVPAAPRDKYKFEGGFCVMGLISIRSIITRYSKDLGKESWLVFWMLCGYVSLQGNRVVLNQAELGRQMGLTRQNVHIAIKQLLEVGLILEGPKEKRSRTYSLNPEVVFRGSAKDHAREIDKYRKKRTKARMKLVEGGKGTHEEPK